MANSDTAKLIAVLEARYAKFDRDLANAANIADRRARTIEKRFAEMNKNVQSQLTFFNKPLAAVGLGFSINQVRAFSDSWIAAGNKIAAAAQIAGRPIRDVNQEMSSVNEIAQRSRSDIEDVASLYAKLTFSSQNLGASQKQISEATEIAVKAFKAGGAAASEQRAAVLQLGQALASGVLQGDELRSIRENAPLLAQAIAKEFNTTIGELKNLGAEGKITSDRVFKAIIGSAAEVEAAFAKTKATSADFWTQLTNSAKEFVGTSSATQGAIGLLNTSMQALANNFDIIGNGAVALGAILVTGLIARGLGPAALAMYQLASASTASAVSVNALNLRLVAGFAAMRTSAALASGMGSALALIGGPGGLAVAGVTAAIAYFALRSHEADERAQDYAKALDEVRKASEGAADAQDGLSGKTEQAAGEMQRGYETALNDLRTKLNQAENDVISFGHEIGIAVEQMYGFENLPPEMQAVITAFAEGKKSAKDVQEEISRLANLNPEFQNLANTLNPLIDKLLGAKIRAEQAALAIKQLTSQKETGDIPLDPGIASRLSDIKNKQGQKIATDFLDTEKRRASGDPSQQISDLKDRLRKNLPAGAIINDDQLAVYAREIRSLEDATSASKRYGKQQERRLRAFEDEKNKIQEKTEATLAEAAVLSQIDPLTEDYGYTLTKVRAEQELLASAQRAGIAITPELKAQILSLAEGYAQATAKVQQLSEQQDLIRQNAEEMNAAFKDATRGWIDDLIEGKSAAEAFANALKKIGSKLIDLSLDSLFSSKGGLFGGGTSAGKGGLLGGAIIPGILHEGGRVGSDGYSHNRAVHSSAFSGAPRFHEGGLVGLRTDEVPAILQKGEFVIPKGMKMGGGPSFSMNYSPVINAPGATPDVVPLIQKALDENNKKFRAAMPSMMRDMQKRGQTRF